MVPRFSDHEKKYIRHEWAFELVQPHPANNKQPWKNKILNSYFGREPFFVTWCQGMQNYAPDASESSKTTSCEGNSKFLRMQFPDDEKRAKPSKQPKHCPYCGIRTTEGPKMPNGLEHSTILSKMTKWAETSFKTCSREGPSMNKFWFGGVIIGGVRLFVLTIFGHVRWLVFATTSNNKWTKHSLKLFFSISFCLALPGTVVGPWHHKSSVSWGVNRPQRLGLSS